MQTEVGRVLQIVRYPVKSMAGECLPAAEVNWQGIAGDRQYAFYRKNDGTRFPWLSARDLPELVCFQARYADPHRPRTSSIEVVAPDGETLTLADAGLAERFSALCGCDIGLLQVGRGIYDAMPVSVATTATHAALDTAYGSALDRRRFRSNLIIEASVRETKWHGKRLHFGQTGEGAEVLLAEPIPRCLMITVDPDTGRKVPDIMRLVARDFANEVGIYGTPARPGLIQVGDPVFVED